VQPGIHVLFELGDHLGSSAVVLDHDTGELVERSSFYAYGATEGDYRPDRWKGFREDYKFTGKEEDVEVGLQYFGKRYLNPFLGRWVSPDPLALHGLSAEADTNVYAYVRGRLLKNTDPLGLQDQNAETQNSAVLSPDATPNAEGTPNQQAAQWGEQYQQADPASRSNIRVQASSDPATFLHSYEQAAQRAEGGEIILNVGHGMHQSGKSVWGFDLAPKSGSGGHGDAPTLRITEDDLAAPPKNAQGAVFDQQRAHHALLKEMGEINAKFGITRVTILACNVGADRLQVKDLANLLMTEVRAFTDKVGTMPHDTDAGPRVAMESGVDAAEIQARTQSRVEANRSHPNDTNPPSYLHRDVQPSAKVRELAATIRRYGI
jgi:RHS repeat-associated protein